MALRMWWRDWNTWHRIILDFYTGLPRRCLSDQWLKLNTEMDIVDNSYYIQFVNLVYLFFQFIISRWLYPLVVHVSTIGWFQIYDIWPMKTMRRCKLSWQLGAEQEELGPIEPYVQNRLIYLHGSTTIDIRTWEQSINSLWNHSSKHLPLTSLFSLMSHPPSGAPPVCIGVLHAVWSMTDGQSGGPQSVSMYKHLLSINSWL